MQPTKELAIKPGQEITAKLYFFNVYAKKPTHIQLEVVEKPANWEVSIFPELKEKKYEVSGKEVSIKENLAVYFSNVSSKKGLEVPGKEWISSKVGYINADYVTIKIKAPENEKIGERKNLKIKGTAFCLGQEGGIALQQERDFDYSIQVTTKYYEKPVEESVLKKLGKNFVNLFSGETVQPVYMISTGFTLILFILLIVLVIIAKRKEIKKELKKEAKSLGIKRK